MGNFNIGFGGAAAVIIVLAVVVLAMTGHCGFNVGTALR